MIGWIDASAGASGDMLLAAALGAGADHSAVESAIAAVAPEAVSISSRRVQRGGLAALKVDVEVATSRDPRGLAEVCSLIDAAALPLVVTQHAIAVFTLLAEAEAAVHDVSTDEVHFHEVGALDAIADIVGVCAAFVSLRLDVIHGSPIAVGGGHIATAHGTLSVPVPAVTRLLSGIPTYAGQAATELCTPTGAALLGHWVSHWGPQPLMVVEHIGIGAGSKDFESHANVTRLLVGSAASPTPAAGLPAALIYETNVDDLDPRLWPAVLQSLLDAGASDVWLTPILMKKGRPAHTLSVLLRPDLGPALRRIIFTETSAIGLREQQVAKHALAREFVGVEVGGQRVAVKVARLDGVVVNVQPEYDDVLTAAVALGRPAKEVLADAVAAATALWQ
ncbi:MAG: nickel pincer cofactor biosynthesis protein LarC [Nocardioidaceae bacterium]|nr:nickel pincer cofactor biosynthesis protein LarC [Nocardioidaceae bacterium]